MNDDVLLKLRKSWLLYAMHAICHAKSSMQHKICNIKIFTRMSSSDDLNCCRSLKGKHWKFQCLKRHLTNFYNFRKICVTYSLCQSHITEYSTFATLTVKPAFWYTRPQSRPILSGHLLHRHESSHGVSNWGGHPSEQWC
jgi:hypothetical protein